MMIASAPVSTGVGVNAQRHLRQPGDGQHGDVGLLVDVDRRRVVGLALGGHHRVGHPGQHVRVGHHPLRCEDEARAVDLPRAGRRDAADLAPPSPAPARRPGSSARAGSGRRHVPRLGGGERVQDVGQAPPVDRRRAASRRPSARRRAPPGRRPAPAPTAAPGWRPAGTASWPAGDATIQATSRTATAETTAPATESTILAGSQVTRVRTRPADGPGQDLPQQRAGQDDDQRGEHPGHASSRRSVGHRPGQLGAQHRPAEEARRWRWRRRAAPAGTRTARTAGRARSAPGRRRTSRSAPHRHRADLPELHVEAALEGVVARRGRR